MKICKVKECNNEVYANTGRYAGYCNKHYLRLYRHGDVKHGKPSPIKRFKKYIKVNKETGCWEWQGHLNNGGYAKIEVNSKRTYIHRFSYKYFKGKIPKGLCVLHRCDNRKCANPDHLFLGTHQDNADDMVKKNRSNKNPKTKGESCPLSKLTNEDIIKIRRMSKVDKWTQAKIADEFNVNNSTISDIINNKTWKHI